MIFIVHQRSSYEFLAYALPTFFVMSGYLITKILLANQGIGLSEALKTFYFRRALRIFPAYYAAVIILFAFGMLQWPIHNLFHTVNIKLFSMTVGEGAPEFLQWFTQNWSSTQLHFWTLSVEEQYYLIYPLVLYLTASRHYVSMLVAILLLSIGSRVWLMTYYPDSFYGALIAPWEYFAWGGLAVFVLDKNATVISPTVAMYSSAVCILILLAIEYGLNLNGYAMFRVTNFQTPMGLCLALFIWGLYNAPSTDLSVRFLSWKPFVYLGEMSYAMYIWHFFTFHIYDKLSEVIPLVADLSHFGVTFFFTVLLGMASRYLIENPALKLKKRFTAKNYQTA